jgi:hypothetical protein
MNKRVLLKVVLCVPALWLLSAGMVLGLIPEPANVIYGTLNIGGETAPNGIVVTLLINEVPIAYYTMGDNPNAQGHYILSVPLDALDPQLSGTARPGDTASIFVNGYYTDIDVTIGTRGQVILLNLDLDSTFNMWDLTHFADFAVYWLVDTCATMNDCDGYDLDKSGKVDMVDLWLFLTNWMGGSP